MEKIVIVPERLVLKQCDATALPAMLALQEQALEALENPSWLRRSSPELYEQFLTPPNYTLGAFYDDKLIAFAVLYAPEEESARLSLRLRPEDIRTDVSRVVNLKVVICDIAYRGNGLQYILMNRLEAVAREKGYDQLCTTVSPENIYSRKNFEKLGYVFSQMIDNYGGFERELYYKNV